MGDQMKHFEPNQTITDKGFFKITLKVPQLTTGMNTYILWNH